MIYEEVKHNLEAMLEEATREEDSVCYVTNEDEETIKCAIKSLEKQIPKKPIEKTTCGYKEYYCPSCEMCTITDDFGYGTYFCSNCGQAIDWSDEE